MYRARRLAVFVAGLLAVLCAVPGLAHADGLPVIGIDAGPGGVPARSGNVRYVTLRAGPDTVLAKIEQEGGNVATSVLMRGTLAVPVVAFDGTPGGVSADGSTLVLIRPRAAFPRASTTFAVVATGSLRTRERVTLRGDFSFDAVSPDGEFVYLIEYTSRTDPTRYRVRAYDAVAGRLLPEPIVDPREPDERMRGYPITRVTSPDGRFEYTLYDGAGHGPFVHALDTEARSAACIDLDALAARADLYELRLAVSADGRIVSVTRANEPLALIDAQTFDVSEPRAAEQPDGARPAVERATETQAAAAAQSSTRGVGTVVPALLGALVAGVGLAALVIGRRRRRVVPTSTS